ncbi:MAG TPA: DUF711 domain-containing protein [Anaerolineaceae bacterium]|nr:DUF711 domain-containing protein [Anaerolineaceae bacterium]
MKIRSITVFCQPGFPVNRLMLQQVGIFADHARKLYQENGFEVQSLRLATPPFEQFIAPVDLPLAAQSYAIEAHADGFEYISLGPVSTNTKAWEVIPQALAKSDRIFLSGNLTTPEGTISLPAARACAETIVRLSTLEKDGFANLRFCALANVPANTPFFPAAYAQPGRASFALALEAADLAPQAFSQARTFQEASELLIKAIEENAKKLEEIGNRLSKMYTYEFKGLDFTLAPYPSDAISIGRALESLGIEAFGKPGSLLASAFLTNTLDQARFTRTGFNGLMLPVLEDSGLARSASDGNLSVRDLLLFSSVCGAGLDVIPLPGDTTAEELTPILLDLAALSLRLNKALTARLMPIPGKKAGEMTEFDFAFFANSRILPVNSTPLLGKFSGNEEIKISPRKTE